MVASTMVPVEMRMPLARQIQVHRIQDLATQLMRLQQAAKTKDPGLIGCCGAPQINTGKAPQHGRLIHPILGARIREIKPPLQKVDAQHNRQTNSLAAVAGRGIVRLDQPSNSRHRTTLSMTLRNCSRRLFRACFSKLD